MKLKEAKTIVATLLGSLLVGSAVAATPTIEARVEPDSVGIGDRFTYSITVDRDLVQVVAFPLFETKDGDVVELVEDLPVDTLEQDGRHLRLRKRYLLTSFQEGRINLGVGRALYLDKNIKDTLTTADSVYVEVGTFQIDSTSQSIYDLKPQYNLPFKYAEIKGYVRYSLLALIVLAAIVLLVLRYLRSKGKRLGDLFKPAPLPAPHIEAIKALEELHNQKLWQNSKYKEYYSSLTHILRHYIARRYEVAAMEMTSEEIIEAMRSVDMPTKSRMDLNALLRDADLVKFAKATPEGDENEESYNKVYYFVEETKIQEEEEKREEEI